VPVNSGWNHFLHDIRLLLQYGSKIDRKPRIKFRIYAYITSFHYISFPRVVPLTSRSYPHFSPRSFPPLLYVKTTVAEYKLKLRNDRSFIFKHVITNSRSKHHLKEICNLKILSVSRLRRKMNMKY
jgi:hypothetical protein